MKKALLDEQDKELLGTLNRGDYSLLVLKGSKTVFKSKGSGISPLVQALEAGVLRDSTVVDRSTGLAAAKLCVWGGVRTIVSFRISHRALGYLGRNKVELAYQNRVTVIKDEGGGICRMELLAQKHNSREDFFDAYQNRSFAKLTAVKELGVFPDGYYTTTNLSTQVSAEGEWLDVSNIEMDLGIRVAHKAAGGLVAECVTASEIREGDLLVVGSRGVRVAHRNITKEGGDATFGFMTSGLSSERQKRTVIKSIADRLKKVRRQGGKALFVMGPAVIHTGAGRYFETLINDGFVQILFSGNGFAVHDIEQQLMGTSLGVGISSGRAHKGGSHNHLWTINETRRGGGIEGLVKEEVLTGGVMQACVTRGVEVVLAGSIRDDGPLPEVITDTQMAQRKMRKIIRRGVDAVVVCASTLHGIAAGNMLPASTPLAVVDNNLASVTKLADRGTTQAVELVTDVEYFLRELSLQLGARHAN